MTLRPTFELTPRSTYWSSSPSVYALLYIEGVSLPPTNSASGLWTFNEQYMADSVLFSSYNAADDSLDYGHWFYVRKAPRVSLNYRLPLAADKQLALVFGFHAIYEARLLIFSNTLLGDVSLVPGDNQFMIIVESLQNIGLSFIHANCPKSEFGGSWYFTGITGYIV